MKTPSVQTCKQIILVTLCLLILIPVVCSVALGVHAGRLRRENETLRSTLSGRAQPEERPGAAAEPAAYQLLYPELYAASDRAGGQARSEDTVYLTFDGGPSASTGQILDLLDQYGVKATFFVVGRTDEDSLAVLRDIVDRGHAIGLSSYSGEYQSIYSSVEAYLADFQKIYQTVLDATGVKPEIFRFPGGSVNAYNSGIYQELIAEMLRRGFVFFDWDVSGEDTRVESTGADVSAAVLAGMEGKSRGIVMLHDSAGKQNVVDALPAVLEGLQNEGYGFQPLSASVLPVVFNYKSAP